MPPTAVKQPCSLPPRQPSHLVAGQFPPCSLARRQVQLDRVILSQRQQLSPSSNRLVVLLVQLRWKLAGVDRGHAREAARRLGADFAVEEAERATTMFSVPVFPSKTTFASPRSTAVRSRATTVSRHAANAFLLLTTSRFRSSRCAGSADSMKADCGGPRTVPAAAGGRLRGGRVPAAASSAARTGDGPGGQ
jgi:hypothetical protein